MTKNTYKMLTKTINDLLLFCEKNLRISSEKIRKSWILQALELVRGLDQTLNDNVAKTINLREKNQNSECLFSLVYLNELKFIYDKIIEPKKIDQSYLFDRIKKILKAPFLISDENTNTNEARNYLLELLFSAELFANDYSPKLFDVSGHPDIELIVNSHSYAIECKRIFALDTFISNFRRAKQQLENYSLNNSSYYFGIPVIDVSRAFIVKNNKNFILKGSNENEANNKALNELESLFHSFRNSFYQNFNPKIPALFLHLSTPVVLENQKPFLFWGHYLSPCELSSQSQISLFHLVKSDFTKLA